MFLPVRFAWTTKGKICHKWKARRNDQRTFEHLHDFTSETWEAGLRLGATSIEHRTAVLRLLSGLVIPSARS